MISRRKFIQSTGISAASLPLISKSHPFAKKKKNQ